MKKTQPQSITFKQQVLVNVNQWRRKNKLPPVRPGTFSNTVLTPQTLNLVEGKARPHAS